MQEKLPFKTKNGWRGGGGLAQWAKRLPCKHEDLSLTHRTNINNNKKAKPSGVGCNLRAEEVEAELGANQSSPLGKFQ